MSRTNNLKTKIFLDSGDPQETKSIIELLGFLDGQTTNPTLISRNPDAKNRLEQGNKFSKQEIYDFYKEIVREISALIPNGSVSIEVYSDKNTSVDDMYNESKKMYEWIPNAHIKFPTTMNGLLASARAIQEGMRVNMTLVFSQAQATAVYSATMGAKKGDVFISPFIGRIDDLGENGMDLIKNILTLYKKGDGHVEVLGASIRNYEHFLGCLALGVDIVTVPSKILKQWAKNNFFIPDKNYIYKSDNLSAIEYEDFDLNNDWKSLDIYHNLTEKGIDKFSEDWNQLISI